MGYSFYYPPENKVFVAQNAEFLENSLITQEASGGLDDLKIIQEEDTHPSENTSIHHDEGDQEINEPQSDVIPFCRVHKDTICSWSNVFIHRRGEYEAGILMNPCHYKLIGQMVNQKETDMDGAVHTPLKARLVAKASLKTYGVDMKNPSLREAAYILRIKIYRDRSKLLIEAEYITALYASKEAVWVRKFIFGLGVVPIIEEPIKMYCDNTRSITIANKSGITKGARYYGAKIHYLRKCVETAFFMMPSEGPDTVTIFPDVITRNCGRRDALLHYDAEMELMNLILLSIPNDIYNSVDACTLAKDMWKRVERLMRGTIQNKVDRETPNTSSYYVTHPTSMVDYDDVYQQDDVHTNSEDPLASTMLLLARARDRYVNIQTEHSREIIDELMFKRKLLRDRMLQMRLEMFKGLFVPRLQGIFQLFNATIDEAGVILTDVQNDFLFADVARMEEIKELSATVLLIWPEFYS
ncbi:hypothetical protein Tco_0328554 [Tanacetum coccineum]